MNVSRLLALRFSVQSPRRFGRVGVVLAVLGVAVGVATIEVALSVVAGFERAVQAQLVGTAGAIRVGPYLPFADDEKRPLPADFALYDSLIQAKQIASATGFVDKASILQSGDALEGVLLHGVDTRWPGGAIAQGLRAGRLPRQDSSGRVELLVSTRLAARLGIAVDSRVRLFFLENRVRARPGVVVGLYQTALAEHDAAVVICPIGQVRKLMQWNEDEVEGFELAAPPDTHVEELNALALRLDPLVPLDQRVSAVQERHPEVFDWLALQQQNGAILLLLMVAVAVVNLASAVLIVITERTHSIGLLKALGASNGLIQRSFLWQAALLLGIGLTLGNLLGLSIIGVQNATGWLTLDPDAYLISTVQMDFVWGRFALANLLLVVVCLLCMSIPVRAAAAVQPVRALKF